MDLSDSESVAEDDGRGSFSGGEVDDGFDLSSASRSASTPVESPVESLDPEDGDNSTESPNSSGGGGRRSVRVRKPKVVFTYDKVGGDPTYQ